MRANLFILALICLAAVGIAYPQSTSATLSGIVVDETGGVVPDFDITILNDGTGLKRQATTSAEGYFTVPFLPPGRYTLRGQRPGFAPVEVTGVVLNVNDQITLRIQLKIATVGEQVTVIADPARVNTSPAVGTVVNRQFLNNLPLNGRSFQSLILLTPGVVLAPSDANRPGQFSVNGQRSNANYFTVDGVSSNIGGAQGGDLGTPQILAGALPGLTTFGGTNGLVSVDALEEFKIQTSTYAAEFGRQPGGQISLITRSGTNRFSGKLFEYFRNDALDANDWFANAAGRKKAALRQNQFGGVLGGPVFVPWLYNGRNRTFFFFSYEGLRLRLPQASVANVPSLRLREVAAPALRPLLAAFPLPDSPELLNAAGQPTGFSPLTGVYSDPSTLDATGIRIDHTLNDKLTLFGRYSEAPSNTATRTVGGVSGVSESEIRTRTLTLGTTASVTPRLTNELRLNISTQRNSGRRRLDDFGGAVPIGQWAAVPNLPEGADVFSQFGVLFPSGVSFVQLGPQRGLNQRQMNLVDNLSWARGAHHLKFGVDYRRLFPIVGFKYDQIAIFTSEASIRSGTVDQFTNQAWYSLRPIYANMSVYGQDSWKLSRRLTLDLGLRWEINPAPGGDGKKMISIIGLDNLPTARLAPPGTPRYKTDYRAFAPRVGVAYQLSEAKGWERVARGGFGFFYDLGSGAAAGGFNIFPFRFGITSPNIPFPIPPDVAAVPPFPGVKLPITGVVYVPDSDLKLPYTLQWNVSVEQSLGPNQAVSASYVAAIGRRLLQNQFTNQLTAGRRPNPNFSSIFLTSNGATSDYHSLQLQYQRRLSRGLQALVNYTWSHAIDEVSDEVAAGELVRGNAGFDVRHNLSSAVTYDLPGRRTGGIVGPVIGNWSVDGIVHAQSATPVNLSVGSILREDGTLISVRPDLLAGQPLYVDDPRVAGGRRFNSAAFQTPPAGRQGTLGKNVLRGLPLYQLDFALRRQFNVTERADLQFRAEAFNLFNHPNFGGLRTNLTPPSAFGVATQMLGRSLGGLSPLYQIGGPRSLQLSLRLNF